MPTPLIHSLTKKYIHTAIKHPHHNYLLIGNPGSGKFTLASYLANRIDSKIAYNMLHLNTQSIAISDVRDIGSFFKLKSPNNRCVLIENIDKMTFEAQNAFLKFLEEPPKNIFIIATSAYPSKLLKTVTSRFETIPVITPKKNDSSEYVAKHSPNANFDKNYALSNGNIGLLLSLTENKQHYLNEYIKQAKNILRSSYFERLKQVDQIINKKNDVSLFLFSLNLLIKAGLINSATNNKKEYEKWLELRKKTNQYTNLEEIHIQPKLMLSTLFMDL